MTALLIGGLLFLACAIGPHTYSLATYTAPRLYRAARERMQRRMRGRR